MSTLAKLLMGASGAEPVPDEPGTPFGGGYYGGRIMVGGVEYALVVAPKTQGDGGDLQWKTSNTNNTGAGSRNDGWANTQSMLQSGSANHPAAAFCRSLNINGYDDWYFPALDELEILYRALKPTTGNNVVTGGENPNAIPPTGKYTYTIPGQTNVEVFKKGGGEDFIANEYWNSTGGGSTANIVNFSSGNQRTFNKTLLRKVRAVRRVAI